MTTPIQYDHAGNPIKVPPRSTLTYEAFAALVSRLTPDCCSYPDGRRIDPKTKEPCRRERCTDEGCELHSSRKAGRMMRYGRYLPPKVRKVFALAVTDGERLNIGHDAALAMARLHELTARLDTGESGKAWERLQEAWTDLLLAQQKAKMYADAGDSENRQKWAEKSIEIMQSIGKIIKSGNENENTWKEILAVSSMAANLKGQETRRAREAGLVLTAEQAMILVDRLRNVIYDRVKDEGVRNAIAADMARLLGLAAVKSSQPTPEPSQPEPVMMPTTTKGLSVDDYLS